METSDAGKKTRRASRELFAATVLKLVLPLAAGMACWAAADSLWDRWWAPWGSRTSSILFAMGLWMWAWRLRQTNGPVRLADACAPAYLAASAVCLAAYAVFYPYLPKLVSCEFALAALACVLLGTLSRGARLNSWGILFLLLLSAHVATSLEFFVGFPLRLVVGKIAALMLGQSITAVGTGLSDGSHTVFIDAPCSGVRMLSTSLALASALAVLMRLSLVRTLGLLAVAGVLAVLGNAERAATLFITTDAGDEFELVFGVIVFGACTGALAYVATLLKPTDGTPDKPQGERALRPALCVFFVLACVAAAIRPFATPGAVRAAVHAAVEWPSTWDGERLIPVPVTEGMRLYLRDFPGDSQQFQLGATGKMVLLRRTDFATRELHSSENCYRGEGVTCTPMPAIKDTGGRLWSQFRLERPFAAVRTVRQCYVSIEPGVIGGALEDWLRDRPSWPDASSWYWAAARPGSPVKATLAVTVLE